MAFFYCICSVGIIAMIWSHDWIAGISLCVAGIANLTGALFYIEKSQSQPVNLSTETRPSSLNSTLDLIDHINKELDRQSKGLSQEPPVTRYDLLTESAK